MKAPRVTAGVLTDIAKAQELYDVGDWDAAEVVIRRFLKHGLAQPLTYYGLGNCAQFQGRLDVALACYRKALAIDPDYVDARDCIIMILDAQPDTTAARAQREREKWWQRHGAALYATRKPHLNDRDPERPLRVGYVSGDFKFHSARNVFERVACYHSDAVQPFFYSNTPRQKWDQITGQYYAEPGWRNVSGWPDALVASKIRADAIDILIDLSGYTGYNRLLTFASKPAPIQLTAWGYATGVGWPAMDGLVSDRVVIPEDRQHEHVERIVYLPCVITFEGMSELPDVGPLPCLTERPTFGVFQRSLKLTAEDLGVYAQILARLPESRLILKSHYCETLKDVILAPLGPQAAQVEFQPVTSKWDHQLAYAQVDLSLDTWPQTGGVTSCESLWDGVPVLTLIGDRVIQRTTASLLTNLGLEDFIATTHEEYIDKAVEWVTTRRVELADIRSGLRERFRASPICAGYVESVEVAYRDLWREWCAQPMTLAEARYRLQAVS